MNQFAAQTEATQGLLTGIYDRLDTTIDLIEAAYQATHGPEMGQGGDAMRAVLEAAKAKARSAKDMLHDTIAWGE